MTRCFVPEKKNASNFVPMCGSYLLESPACCVSIIAIESKCECRILQMTIAHISKIIKISFGEEKDHFHEIRGK